MLYISRGVIRYVFSEQKLSCHMPVSILVKAIFLTSESRGAEDGKTNKQTCALK